MSYEKYLPVRKEKILEYEKYCRWQELGVDCSATSPVVAEGVEGKLNSAVCCINFGWSIRSILGSVFEDHRQDC